MKIKLAKTLPPKKRRKKIITDDSKPRVVNPKQDPKNEVYFNPRKHANWLA